MLIFRIFIFFLFISPLSRGQDTKRFAIVDLYAESKHYDSSLQEYCRENNSIINRNSFLDSLCSKRINYFLNVLIYSTKNELKESFNNITVGRKSHRPLFGDSLFFRSPGNNCWTSAFEKNYPEGIKGKAEIMQQTFFSKSFRQEQSESFIIDVFLKEIEKKFSTDFILNGYKKSKDHNSAILNYAKGKYGSSTKILIMTQYDKEKSLWKYEAIVYNLTIFSQPLKK
jgi:hypothetical protein